MKISANQGKSLASIKTVLEDLKVDEIADWNAYFQPIVTEKFKKINAKMLASKHQKFFKLLELKNLMRNFKFHNEIETFSLHLKTNLKILL